MSAVPIPPVRTGELGSREARRLAQGHTAASAGPDWNPGHQLPGPGCRGAPGASRERWPDRARVKSHCQLSLAGRSISGGLREDGGLERSLPRGPQAPRGLAEVSAPGSCPSPAPALRFCGPQTLSGSGWSEPLLPGASAVATPAGGVEKV